MTTTQPIEVGVAAVPEPALTLDDLDHYVLDNGGYVFLGNVPDIMKKVESIGFQVYYVLSEEKYYELDEKGARKTTASFRPQVFKVVNNMVGRLVGPTNEVSLAEIESNCWFTLPKIPIELVNLAEAFFRQIDKDQGTEAIVMLTYDPEVGGSEGWGMLTPDQENTSHDCDYKPESIADEKPDHVYIVGSIHSHPKMSAYASGTDHKDQADFDGIHITIGWQSHVNNGATQYYAEMQMGGTGVRINHEAIFQGPKVEVDQTVIDTMCGRVTKKSYVQQGGFNRSTPVSSAGRGGNSQPARSAESYRVKALPAGSPDHNLSVIIAMITEGAKKCPFCETKLIAADFEKRRCMACHQYLALTGESVEDIVKVRKDANVYTHDIDVALGHFSKPVYMWNVEEVDKDKQFDLIYPATGSAEPKADDEPKKA